MKLSKYIGIFLLLIVLMSACRSSNEDPTNIELEVLRASLLEKELYIDELTASIDQYQEEVYALQDSVYGLEEQISELKERNDNLLGKQEQVLQIATKKEGFFQIYGNGVYMVFQYEDAENDYQYEELYYISPDARERAVHRSEQLEFIVNEDGNVFVTDLQKIFLYDTNLDLIKETELELALTEETSSFETDRLLIKKDETLSRNYLVIPIRTQMIEALCIVDFTDSDLKQKLIVLEGHPKSIEIDAATLAYQVEGIDVAFQVDLSQ